ncbi:hypothetical protein P7K49_002479 [Saguinus oedipus]|uniref:Phosphatase and actin regulator n=1 Tax=Saguinus oedipus TaxID=9490 RepID=A0ABQ9WHF3_SAGOE|nr:hypothetical protein P7K49_002479 [Saguinus oedipus]
MPSPLNIVALDVMLCLQTEDYLKRKIRSRPERSELVRMHILEGVEIGIAFSSKPSSHCVF